MGSLLTGLTAGVIGGSKEGDGGFLDTWINPTTSSMLNRTKENYYGLAPGFDLLFPEAPKTPEPVQPKYQSQPEFGGFEGMGVDFEAQQADFDKRLEEQRAEAARNAGLSEMNSAYGSKFDAASKATAEVNQQIADESSHARLRGLDYTVPEGDAKLERINNVFSNYWSESQESQLGGLVSKWGKGSNVWDSGIKRGAGSSKSIISGGEKAGGKVAASTKAPTTSIVKDEDKLGGTTSILG